MNMKHTLCALSALLLSTIAAAEPFTYQGSLSENGEPANGEYDLRFELYDAQVGGNMIGGIQGEENYQVVDGIFTVELDFGSGAFDASSRYLRVGVRPGDSGGVFTFFDPRTPINPTPKAQHAATADELTNPIWNQSGSVVSSGDGLGRVFINRDSAISTAEYFGVHADTTGFVGMYISGPAGALPFYGYSVDGGFNAYSYYEAGDNEWVLNKDGLNRMTIDNVGDLIIANDAQAESFRFENPKLNYCSISGDAFHSASGDTFFGSSGAGGAYIADPSSGWLVAPVSLPHGAIVTRFLVYFDDISASIMTVTLNRRSHGGSAASGLASISTAGFNGAGLEAVDNSISTTPINNALYHYHIRVYSDLWPGNSSLRIKSVVIEYTTNEAD